MLRASLRAAGALNSSRARRCENMGIGGCEPAPQGGVKPPEAHRALNEIEVVPPCNRDGGSCAAGVVRGWCAGGAGVRGCGGAGTRVVV